MQRLPLLQTRASLHQLSIASPNSYQYVLQQPFVRMEPKQKGKLNSYFQIIGVLVLLTHTLLMGLQILWGLLLVLLNCLKDLALTLLDFLQVQNLVLLAIWILLLALLSNSQIRRIEQQLLDEPATQKELNCLVCNRQRSQKSCLPCLHSFHLQCLRRRQAETQLQGCPECSHQPRQDHYFLARLHHLYAANPSSSQLFIAVFALAGVFGFFQTLKQS